MRRSTQFAAILGTFFGGLLGSTGTILVFKKLDKLEHKKDLEAEAEHIAEVAETYEIRIKKLKEYYESKEIEEENDISEIKKSDEIVNEKAKEAHKRITLDKVIENPDEPKILNPKFVYQDRLAEEDNAKPTDYSKISRDKYTDLKKEYEREPIIDESVKFPHLITQDSYEHAGGYVKEEVMYYEQNGIFATLDDDTIVDHITEEYIGLDNLNLFGSQQASLDGKSSLYELYLRDEVLHIDYHIIYNGTEDFDHLGDCR